MELEAKDAVADVPKTGRAVRRHRLLAALDVGQQQNAVGAPDVGIIAEGGHVLEPAGLGAVERTPRRHLQQPGHGPALGLEPIGEPTAAELVDQLERAVAPGVAEAHGLIDGDDVIGDLGHQIGGVGEGGGQHPPGVAPALVGVGEQRAGPALARRPDAFEVRFPRRAVFAGRQIARLLDPFRRLGLEPVEPALALAPGITLLDHPGDQLGFARDLMEGVVRRQGPFHAGEDVGHQIEADHVEQPEHPGLGDAHRPAHHGVRFLDRDAVLDRRDDGGLQPIDADPVGDEAGRVLGVDHALAQADIGEPAHRRDLLRVGSGAGDDLDEAHVAGRVEEMGDQEVGGEALRQALGQYRQRQRRGVRRDDG